MNIALAVNAEPVRHGSYSSESPTRTTPTLVPNLSDGGAVWPLLPWVKALRDVLYSHQKGLPDWWKVSICVWEHPH